MAMKEKIKELEAKDAASKESERTQMNQLIQREKELEKLRMDQWREKSAMMEKMKRVKEEHDKKLKEIIDEKNMQNVEKEQKVKEEEERKMNEASEMKTLSKQAHAADQRAGKHGQLWDDCCDDCYDLLLQSNPLLQLTLLFFLIFLFFLFSPPPTLSSRPGRRIQCERNAFEATGGSTENSFCVYAYGNGQTIERCRHETTRGKGIAKERN